MRLLQWVAANALWCCSALLCSRMFGYMLSHAFGSASSDAVFLRNHQRRFMFSQVRRSLQCDNNFKVSEAMYVYFSYIVKLMIEEIIVLAAKHANATSSFSSLLFTSIVLHSVLHVYPLSLLVYCGALVNDVLIMMI